MLQVNQLKKQFGHTPVLRGVSFGVNEGESAVLLGPNGAGKSTLFNCIAMALRPTSGQITCDGRDIFAYPGEFRRQLGYISHFLFLYGDLTGLENLRFFARLYGLPASSPRIEESLQLMGMQAYRHQLVRTYSRGMKQRLSIARAMLHNPRLILLDEPFTGLDRHAAAKLQDLLARLKAEGKTVLMISHQLEHALAMGDRILTLVRGKIRDEQPARGLEPASLAARYMEVVARFEKEP